MRIDILDTPLELESEEGLVASFERMAKDVRYLGVNRVNIVSLEKPETNSPLRCTVLLPVWCRLYLNGKEVTPLTPPQAIESGSKIRISRSGKRYKVEITMKERGAG